MTNYNISLRDFLSCEYTPIEERERETDLSEGEVSKSIKKSSCERKKLLKKQNKLDVSEMRIVKLDEIPFHLICLINRAIRRRFSIN